jgi:hypothetical protein
MPWYVGYRSECSVCTVIGRQAEVSRAAEIPMKALACTLALFATLLLPIGMARAAGKHDAKMEGRYHEGMAVFTIAKGGSMYNATVAGQKFSFTPGEHAR